MTTELTNRARRTAAVAGVHERDPRSRTPDTYPGAIVDRLFIEGLQPPPRGLMTKIKALTKPRREHNPPRISYISYKPRHRDVMEGRWDGFHHELGAWLADNPTVRIIVHHEPEGGEDRIPAKKFAEMFNRARKEIKEGWEGAHVAYCAMAYQWGPWGDTEEEVHHWKSVEADEYLCDVYSGKSFPETAILPEHPGFENWFNKIVKPRLEDGEAVAWGIGERGFMAEKDRVRAKAIRDESAWLTGRFDRYDATGLLVDVPPSLYVAWSSPGREEDPRWVLTGDSVTAMSELIAAFAERGAIGDN